MSCPLGRFLGGGGVGHPMVCGMMSRLALLVCPASCSPPSPTLVCADVLTRLGWDPPTPQSMSGVLQASVCLPLHCQSADSGSAHNKHVISQPVFEVATVLQAAQGAGAHVKEGSSDKRSGDVAFVINRCTLHRGVCRVLQFEHPGRAWMLSN